MERPWPEESSGDELDEEFMQGLRDLLGEDLRESRLGTGDLIALYELLGDALQDDERRLSEHARTMLRGRRKLRVEIDRRLGLER